MVASLDLDTLAAVVAELAVVAAPSWSPARWWPRWSPSSPSACPAAPLDLDVLAELVAVSSNRTGITSSSNRPGALVVVTELVAVVMRVVSPNAAAVGS